MARTGPPRAVLETLGPGHAIAAFSTSADAQVWVILTGGDDSLAIFTVSAGESANDILFDGERDGCD
jgi:hypothetical protein